MVYNKLTMGIFGSAPKIVIVEDNVALADIYKVRLEIIGYKCFVASDGAQALTLIEQEKPALVLLDLMIPVIAGDEVLKRMRATAWGKDIKVHIMSNLNEADAPAGLRDHGIEGYSVKSTLANDDLDRIVADILSPPTDGSTDTSPPATDTASGSSGGIVVG
jgi:DNA-binding response OmpR family regulator